MPKIQCIQFARTHVENQTYEFKRDDKGRFVAEVSIPEHVDILLGLVGVYSLVKDEPAQALTSAQTPPLVPSDTPNPDGVSQPAADDLTALKGIGKKLAEKLATLGITTYAQLAALDEAGQAAIDDALNKTGAIYRDEWVSQAQALTSAPLE